MNGHVDYSRLEQTVFRNSSIRELRVLLVGAGALGNEVAKTLGLLGIGFVTVVDPDIIESHNLTRSVFFRAANCIGEPKASRLSKSMERQFPDTRVTPFAVEIADVGLSALISHDIVFSCVHSDLARLEIAYISSRLRIPVVDGGLGTADYSSGRASYFPGQQGACYGCLLPPHRRRELLTTWESNVRHCNFTQPAVANYSSTPTMAAVVAAMQVEVGLRQILDSKPSHEGFSFDICLHPFQRLGRCSVQRCDLCPFHPDDRPHLFPASGTVSKTTVRDLFNAYSIPHNYVLVLDWPICQSSKCRICNHKWNPRVRLGAFRQHGRCPACASIEVEEQTIIRSVSQADESFDQTLADLGMPENHLYSFRPKGTA